MELPLWGAGHRSPAAGQRRISSANGAPQHEPRATPWVGIGLPPWGATSRNFSPNGATQPQPRATPWVGIGLPPWGASTRNFSPNGATQPQPRATPWVCVSPTIPSPERAFQAMPQSLARLPIHLVFSTNHRVTAFRSMNGMCGIEAGGWIAPSGLGMFLLPVTQGVALGWHGVAPLGRRTQIARRRTAPDFERQRRAPTRAAGNALSWHWVAPLGRIIPEH